MYVPANLGCLNHEFCLVRRGPAVAVVMAALLFIAAAGCSSDPTSTPPSPTPPPAPTVAPVKVGPLTLAKVVHVVDGATIDVEIDGRVFRVKYLGIELPDMVGPEADSPSLDERALEFNRFHVQGQTVDLEKDPVANDTSGLLLRYVYVSGEMVNKALLTNGYATVAPFPADFRHKTAFAVEEESAKRSRRGIWSPGAQDTDPNGRPPGPSTPVPFKGGTLPAPPGMTDVTSECDYSGTTEPVIKGNVNSQTGDLIFHVPGGFYYSTTAIEEDNGDRWFCTEHEAMAAGWKKSKR